MFAPTCGTFAPTCGTFAPAWTTSTPGSTESRFACAASRLPSTGSNSVSARSNSVSTRSNSVSTRSNSVSTGSNNVSTGSTRVSRRWNGSIGRPPVRNRRFRRHPEKPGWRTSGSDSSRSSWPSSPHTRCSIATLQPFASDWPSSKAPSRGSSPASGPGRTRRDGDTDHRRPRQAIPRLCMMPAASRETGRAVGGVSSRGAIIRLRWRFAGRSRRSPRRPRLACR